MKNYILIVLGTYLFSSCGILSAFRIRDARHQEHISAFQFYEEIPFQMVNGLIIIPIEISGITRNFIFDTGAHTLITDSTLSQFSHQTLGTTKTFDVHLQKKKLKTVQIDQLYIGKIPFFNTIASTADFSSFSEMNCNEISGIIGINIINKGIWQIDYQRNILIFTDQLQLLHFSKQSNTIHFNSNAYGYPILPIHINGAFIGDGLLDTGYNGSILLSNQTISDSLPSFIQYNYTHALHSYLKTTQKIVARPLQLDQVKIDTSIIAYSTKNPSPLIGNRFLQNYRVTLNTNTSELTLDQLPNRSSPYINFGFYPISQNDQIIIGSIYDHSDLYKSGVRLGDRILKINQIDLSSTTSSQLCEILDELKKSNLNEISISIAHQNQILDLKIKKRNALKKTKL